MRNAARGRLTPLVVGVIVALMLAGGLATAASLITTNDVKNNTLRMADLTKKVRHKIKKHAVQGPQGQQGPQGPKGATGSQGPPGLGGGGPASDGNWGIVDRNVIGSPDISQRSGPATPPLGSGSLNFTVANVPGSTEKAAFGNEVDFLGQPIASLNQVGFYVYETGEDADKGPANMPSIGIEINPNGANGTTTTFSTLVYSPDNSPRNQWSPFIDAANDPGAHWGLTGSQFNSPATAANCGINGPRCTFADVKSLLATGTGATIYTVQVTKGRDLEWQGAIDGLRINSTNYDFEEYGVISH